MRKNRLFSLILLIAALLLCVLLYLFPPGEYQVWPPCVFHELTGIYCPGCGNTRALALLMHGDLAGSLAKNILLIPALICLLALAIRPRLAMNRVFSVSIAVVVIAFFVLRNLPWYPFSLLAPH